MRALLTTILYRKSDGNGNYKDMNTNLRPINKRWIPDCTSSNTEADLMRRYCKIRSSERSLTIYILHESWLVQQ